MRGLRVRLDPRWSGLEQIVHNCRGERDGILVALLVEDIELEWYAFAPVHCGSDLAYVPWTRSLLGHAVIVMGTSGRHELRQIVGAECDSPIIQTWDYDERGRHERRSESSGELLASGGC